MKKKNVLKWMLAVGIVAIAQAGFAQQSLKINSQKSSMTISGTTNVHDFESKVTQINGEMTFEDSQPKTLRVEIPVKSIVSKEKLMDKKTYEAFNEPKNPKIIFVMTTVNSVQVNGNQVSAKVTGNLTMAGATKKITITGSGKKIKQGTYVFTGSTQIKFSDFEMKPPTAMMVMKVGNVITLNYSITFNGDDVL